MWGQDISQKKSKKYYATKSLSVLQLCPKVKNIPHLCCARKIPQEKLLEAERTHGTEKIWGPSLSIGRKHTDASTSTILSSLLLQNAHNNQQVGKRFRTQLGASFSEEKMNLLNEK